jgi:hypothetical protein
MASGKVIVMKTRSGDAPSVVATLFETGADGFKGDAVPRTSRVLPATICDQ